MDQDDLKTFIKELIDEEFGATPTAIHPRWTGGKLVMHPNNDTQPKEVPMEVFFKKLLTVRDSLRVLEQKINSSSASAEEKATWHSYITKGYGTLTTFNILFSDEKDKFIGSSKKSVSSTSKIARKSKESFNASEAKTKLGMGFHGED